MPAVPGAKGLKPEPKPRAMRCAGCLNMKRIVARVGGVSASGDACGASTVAIAFVAGPSVARAEGNGDGVGEVK